MVFPFAQIDFGWELGCTDAALDPAHPRLTRWDAVTREGRRRPRVHAVSCHVDFPTRSDATQIGVDSCRFGSDTRQFASNQTDSHRFGPNRIVSAEYRCFSVGKRKSAGKGKKKKKKNLNRKYRWTGLDIDMPLLSVD